MRSIKLIRGCEREKESERGWELAKFKLSFNYIFFLANQRDECLVALLLKSL